MYSLVVMAALTTGVQTPDCWFHGGCSGYYGCGGCYGCWGCGGCYGGYGSCWGCWGGYSYYSGCYGCSGYYGCGGGCYGCWGCSGCYGYSGYAPMYGPGPVMPSAPSGDLGTPQKEKKNGTSLNPNRARLLVEVPADAKLFIDDQPIKMTATSKTFNTPALERGQSYYYMVKVEVARDGVTHTETRKVVIRAGDEVSARFTEQGVIAAARASAAAR
jgi:uncharacterized protein (TIGR03000 family)